MYSLLLKTFSSPRKLQNTTKKSNPGFSRLFLNMSFPSLATTWNVQTQIFLFSVENRNRAWNESLFRLKRLFAKDVQSEAAKEQVSF
jgi:hypothetical protein